MALKCPLPTRSEEPPRPRPDTAIICFAGPDAERLRRQIASRDSKGELIYPKSQRINNPDFIVIHVGEMVHGYRWKNVLIPRSTRDRVSFEGDTGRFEDWLRECVACRLLLNGQIIELP
jgi:hypothetical protein